MKRLIPVLFPLFFFLGCSEKTPEGILSKEKMANVLTDIHLVDGYASTMATDSAQIKTPVLYQSVYKKYQTNAAQFKKSMAYYSNYPEKMQEIYTQVTRTLKKLQKAEQKRLDEKAKKEKKSQQDSIKKNKKDQKKILQDSVKTDSIKKKELQEALKKRKLMILRNRNKGQRK